MIYSRSIFYITLVVGLIAYQASAHARMYRWVAEDGRIFYSDNVPPKDSKKERKILNHFGRVISTTPAAKTKEQFALEKRLKILRYEQDRIISKQKSNDKVLLSTFRNIDDLRDTLEDKLLAVEAQGRVHQRTLDNLQDNLARTRKKAAQVERTGSKVSTMLLGNIGSIVEKINIVKRDILDIQDKAGSIQSSFDKDIKRFLFLTKGSDNNQHAQALSDKTAEMKAANTLGLYNCQNNESCRKAWDIAKEFVTNYSTTSINFNTDALIMANDPKLASDLSLSASKAKRKNDKVSIFLDIRCHNSTLGTELCQSSDVKKLRQSFRPYIEGGLE